MIYLDAAATIKTRDDVVARMKTTMDSSWGNVSGAHSISRQAKNLLELARETSAHHCNVSPDSIVFTSGATEALNLVIQGYARKNPNARFFVSQTEHPAIIETGEFLVSTGRDVTFIPVDENGCVDISVIEQVQFGDLVSVMAVNNETGVIQDVEGVARIAHERGALVLVDAVQSLYSFTPSEITMNADFAVFSSHKWGGPQGVGVVAVSKRSQLEPLIFGGTQEWELRPGTTPAYLCDALSYTMTQALSTREIDSEHCTKIRDHAEKLIDENITGSAIHSRNTQRSPHIISVRIADIEAQMLVVMLDERGVCVSRGSACASGATTPSPVLVAMGIDGKDATSTIRLSFSSTTTIEEVTIAVDVIAQCVDQLRNNEMASA